MSDPRTDDRDAAAPDGEGSGSAYDRLIGLLEAGGSAYGSAGGSRGGQRV
ncbi:hypothetical protein Acsp04_20880 [Actinomadura sp. NBRC 104425]|nr:hypothetical protein [Actinomadura sp. NBRC 104425]GLZ11853.1 hypothetical protein Acsp04_20880 [Actinomadura sp. NBRC 104425]